MPVQAFIPAPLHPLHPPLHLLPPYVPYPSLPPPAPIPAPVHLWAPYPTPCTPCTHFCTLTPPATLVPTHPDVQCMRKHQARDPAPAARYRQADSLLHPVCGRVIRGHCGRLERLSAVGKVSHRSRCGALPWCGLVAQSRAGWRGWIRRKDRAGRAGNVQASTVHHWGWCGLWLGD